MRKKRKGSRGLVVVNQQTCLMQWCGKNVCARGLCRTHYDWHRYHKLENHDIMYFYEYVVRLQELAGRGEFVIDAFTKTDRSAIRKAATGRG